MGKKGLPRWNGVVFWGVNISWTLVLVGKKVNSSRVLFTLAGKDITELYILKFHFAQVFPLKTSADESDSKPSEYASCESDSSVETSASMPEPAENASKVVCETKVWTDAPIIKEYESDSDNDSVSNVQKDKEKPSFAFTDSVKHDDPHRTLKDKRIVDSECSRHMTGNKAHLADYQDFKGGSVTFGGDNGRITGKGKIKTGRQHNMYSFNLKNIDPSGDLACLFAKASIDESNKWHRRLGHVIFKNLNKLAKGNLVRGLPSKIFENDHTCVACQKRKQHKASCKAKTAKAVNTACYVLNMVLVTKPQNKTPYELLTEEIDLNEEHFILPIWSAYSTTVKISGDKIKKNIGFKTCEKPVSQVEQVFLEELEKLKRHEKKANDAAESLRKEATHDIQNASTSNTNLINTASTPLSTAGSSRAFSDGELSYPDPSKYALSDDPLMPRLEDINSSPSEGIFIDSSYDDEGVVTDFNNLETTVSVSPTPTTRIHTINPKTQILRDPKSAVQTRSKVNTNSEAHALLNLPFGKKAIGTKWVYRNKKDQRGVVVRNKARLVNQRHRQEERIDYDESAFLYGTIDKEVYVSQPPGFVDTKFPNKVYKVVKALYGLHQAPRAWYATLSTFLKKSGYRRGAIDKTLFIKKDKKDIMLVQVNMDDIIFGSTKKSWCDEFEELMKNMFQISSMSELTFFLGLQVKQKEDDIFISQDKYVAEILRKFNFLSVKTTSTPIETQKPLVKDEEAADVGVHLYRSMIGSLIYLTASRPDIMFAVCACSRFQVTPKTSHLHAVKRIFRYLKGQPKLGLWYPKVSSFDLEAYSDSDYAGVNLDRKSTTGGCQFFGKRLISWQCKKQTIVATFTTDTEYVVIAHCCGQVLWIQNQLLDYGFNFMNTNIYIDNKSTIYIVKNPVFNSKTKNIEIRHHFIRDAYEKKLIQVLKIHTDDNVVDLLTKAFIVSNFNFLLDLKSYCWDEGSLSVSLNTTQQMVIGSPCLIHIKNWLVQNKELASLKQTALGKDISNPLMAASVWRDQKGMYGLAKRYPLTHFTLEQMLNNVRLEVEKESEMYLELLRLVRRQLNESTGDLYPVTKPSTIPHAFLTSQYTWHQRLGHPGSEVLRRLVSSDSISCNKEKLPILCHACQLGKHVNLSFVSSSSSVTSCFDIVHSDLWTSPIPSLSSF
nr:putative ribonuclease H-like domain-containing protein [Tanacetum cinerariifolium]